MFVSVACSRGFPKSRDRQGKIVSVQFPYAAVDIAPKQSSINFRWNVPVSFKWMSFPFSLETRRIIQVPLKSSHIRPLGAVLQTRWQAKMLLHFLSLFVSFLRVHTCIAGANANFRCSHTHALHEWSELALARGDVLSRESEIDESARMPCDPLLGCCWGNIKINPLVLWLTS